MNNLKRVLSLALSGIMLVGMMTVGAGAANFVDADEIKHDDAVNTMVALNIINGKDDGSHFDPNGDVTRAEMAKMIAVAMNGGTDTNTGTKTTPSFTDIKGHWAESYIEYCYDMRIISGRGDGTFDPNGNVTGTEATKMVLTALGYDAEAYKLQGASWAVQTTELARSADPSIFEELGDVVMSNKASRDTAAQLIWNGLQNQTKKITPSQNTNTGEVTWLYGDGDIMLYERYNARIWTGTYAGNHNTDESIDEGSISVKDGKLTYYNPTTKGTVTVTGTVEFPSDLDISNIGEEVKVVFKDGKGGTDNKPDKKDTIYGVFNTGKTQVYKVTKNDLQTTDAKKVKFDGSTYNMIDGGAEVITNYITDVHPATTAANAGLKAQSADTIKFVCDDEGKIAAAYVVELNVAKVTSATASKITLSSEGAIDIADNDIADGLAKDDVVVYTKFYSTKKDDAFYTVEKAETVEGQMTGFKFDSSEYKNVVVDGTTYKFHEPQGAAKLPKVTDDAVADLFDLKGRDGAAIGDQIRVYMVGGMAYAVEAIEQTGGNYAIITEVSTTGTIGSSMEPVKVNVMLADGTEQILTVHKDSTYLAKAAKGTVKVGDAVKLTAWDADTDGSTAASAQKLLSDGNVGTLVEYTSIANGSIKLKDIFVAEASYGAAGSTATIWNEDTKKLAWAAGTSGSAVAATNSVLFVGVDSGDSTTGGDGKVDKWYVYDLRNLGTFKSTYFTGGNSPTDVGVNVSHAANSNGLVSAAYITLNGRPGSSTAETLYGIVTGFVGSRQNSAGDDLFRYTVAVGRDEDVEVNVVNDNLTVGSLIRFDETNNGEYELGETLYNLVTATDTVATAGALDETNTKLELAAIRDYTAGNSLLTYFSSTTFDVDTKIYEGTKESATVAKDVKIFYVNGDDDAQGEETGVMTYDTSTGYANALLHFNSNGVVDVIIVETSGEVNLATVATKDVATGLFGNNKAPLPTSTNATALKQMDDGIYIKTDAVLSGATSSAKPANLMYFKFTAQQYNKKTGTDADGNDVFALSDQKYTLTITDDNGAVVYTEVSDAELADGGHFFYVDLSGDKIATSASGSLASGTSLSAGLTYSYKIVGEDGNTYLSGSFVAGTYSK